MQPDDSRTAEVDLQESGCGFGERRSAAATPRFATQERRATPMPRGLSYSNLRAGTVATLEQNEFRGSAHPVQTRRRFVQRGEPGTPQRFKRANFCEVSASRGRASSSPVHLSVCALSICWTTIRQERSREFQRLSGHHFSRSSQIEMAGESVNDRPQRLGFETRATRLGSHRHLCGSGQGGNAATSRYNESSLRLCFAAWDALPRLVAVPSFTFRSNRRFFFLFVQSPGGR